MNCCGGLQTIDKPVVLIIGAGFGGLGAARTLVKNGGTEDYHVVLVDTKDYFSIGGLWQFVWNSRLDMDQVQMPLRKANLPGVELQLNRSVSSWFPEEKKVIFDNGKSLSYHSVILACGVIGDPTSIPGIETYVNICTEAHVEKQKQDMIDLAKKAESEEVTFCMSISVNPYKCPPAPYEMVFLVDEYLRKANVRENCRVIVTCPVEWTMPPNTKPVFMKEFQEKNIIFMNNKELEKIEDNTIHFRDGDTLDFTTLWTIYPIRAPDFVQSAGLDINAKGTITVGDKVTNTIPKLENAYVIGDACTVPIGAKAGVPKAGEFAWLMGQSAADAIVGNVQPAVRAGKCAAEAGFGRGLVLMPNFSDPVNDPENGKPKVGIEISETGTTQKIDWANGYIKEIFDDAIEPLSLS